MARIKVVAFADVQEPGDLVVSQEGCCLLGHRRRAHLDKRRLLYLLLKLKPAKQLLQAAIVPRHSGGRDRLFGAGLVCAF
jgi:hypothetical protein